MMLFSILTTVGSLIVLSHAATWQQTPGTVCPLQGMAAHLPWRYTLEAGESVDTVIWYKGTTPVSEIAKYEFSSNTFTPNTSYAAPGKLAFDTTTRDHNVSITINNVTLADASPYSVSLQPVEDGGDNTDGRLLVLQGSIQFCAIKGSLHLCASSISGLGRGTYTFSWELSGGNPVTTMDMTVDYDGRQIASCSDMTSCTSQAVDLSGHISTDVILEASIALKVDGAACYQMIKTNVMKFSTALEGPSTNTTTRPSSASRLATGGLAGIIVVCVILLSSMEKARMIL